MPRPFYLGGVDQITVPSTLSLVYSTASSCFGHDGQLGLRIAALLTIDSTLS